MLALAGVLALSPVRAAAVTSCQVHVSSKTGVIDVFASGVSGPLLWGDRSGSEANTFANAGACLAGSTARKCEFGPPGTAQAITPPDLCTVYLNDGGQECTAFVKGCTPGPRFTDQAKADDLKQLVAAVSFHHSVPTMVFTGVNVQIVSGSGATDGPVNGTGNLIIGYNATTTSPIQSGSHNVVVGDEHTFTSYGGLVAGHQNGTSGPWASVIGGTRNTASGQYASVSGGDGNTASGISASVSGGGSNAAAGVAASVSGGRNNTASGFTAAVSGGEFGVASGDTASVTAGSGNAATNFLASVSGGFSNTASGVGASVSGGQCNLAGPGPTPFCGADPRMDGEAVSGGFTNVANGDASSVNGGVSNTASGLVASVSGGGSNTAATTASSVSGGAFITATSLSFEWHSGRSSGFPTGTEY